MARFHLFMDSPNLFQAAVMPIVRPPSVDL